MIIWTGFILLILILLAIDLGILNKNPHHVSTKEALRWTGLWVSLSLLFSIFIYFAYTNRWLPQGNHVLSGKEAVITYLTGYLVEQSLSIDNIFVIAIIFSYFNIPQANQHRVLFWGILGAILFRGIMIGIGAVLIERFTWIVYIFGFILLYAAYKMLKSGTHESIHPENNPTIKLVKRFFPVTSQFHGDHFFILEGRRWVVTPLFITLMVVETTDIMFAFDSIPAIFAITTDPFIVFTSNIFAILGLRSLYFVLAAFIDKFEYLKYSLVAILAFVGIKMLVSHHVHLPDGLSLGFIIVALSLGVILSIWKEKRKEME
jgi:tellurite resistance protein TerC